MNFFKRTIGSSARFVAIGLSLYLYPLQLKNMQ